MAANLPSKLNFTQYRDLVKSSNMVNHYQQLFIYKSSLEEALPPEL
ncbi:hypothetical protein ACOBV9_22350 (plasmid) [Pseudoalteromonas espejiana]